MGVPIEKEVDAWLAFIATDSIETRRRIITSYPEFKEIYKEVQSMIRSPGFLLRLFKRDAQDDTKYSELMQSEMEGEKKGEKKGSLKELLRLIKKGYIVNEDAIKESAEELGYTMEEINKMLSDNPNETYDED